MVQLPATTGAISRRIIIRCSIATTGSHATDADAEFIPMPRGEVKILYRLRGARANETDLV